MKDSPYKGHKNYGKTIAVFGGSLSVNKESDAAKQLWANLLNAEVTTYGVGGAGFSSQQGYTLQQQVEDAGVYDVYVLWASTNDYTNSRYAKPDRIDSRFFQDFEDIGLGAVLFPEGHTVFFHFGHPGDVRAFGERRGRHGRNRVGAGLGRLMSAAAEEGGSQEEKDGIAFHSIRIHRAALRRGR